jgi:hypothetical protein
MVALVGYLLSATKARVETERSIVINDIELSLRQALGNRANILRTLGDLTDTANDDFRNCVLGGGAVPCITNRDLPYPFRLHVAGQGAVLTGLDPTLYPNLGSSEVTYDWNGSRCPGSDCPIKVTTFFRAQCRMLNLAIPDPIPEPDCSSPAIPLPPPSLPYPGQGNADTVEVIYSIVPPAVSRAAQSTQPVEGSMVLDVKEILAAP